MKITRLNKEDNGLTFKGLLIGDHFEVGSRDHLLIKLNYNSNANAVMLLASGNHDIRTIPFNEKVFKVTEISYKV